MITPDTPLTICQYCGNWHYCSQTRTKLRKRKNGTAYYPLLSLCHWCTVKVEIIEANEILAWELVA